MRYLIAILLFLLVSANSYAATVVDNDFESGFSPMAAQSFWSLDSTGGVDGSQCAKLTVSEDGTPNKAMYINVPSYESNEWWVEFDVKFVGNGNGGNKFVKLFGDIDTASRNNLTIGLYNTGLKQRGIGYNLDVLCSSKYNGVDSGSCTPTHVVDTDYIYFTSGTWYHLKYQVVRADPGVINGSFRAWADGVLRGYFTGMNSNPSSSVGDTSYLERIEIGGYVGPEFTTTWYMYVDNLYIGTTEKSSTGEAVRSNPIPSSTLPYGTTQATLGITTDTSATCKYDVDAGIAYASMTYTFSSTGGTEHTTNLVGLTNGQSVPHYVKCDNGVTVNSSDYTITVAVASAGCEQDADLCETSGECEAYWPTYNWCAGDTPSCTSSACTTTCEDDADLCDDGIECATYWPTYNWCVDDNPQCTSSACSEPPTGSLSQSGSGTISQDGSGSCSQ